MTYRLSLAIGIALASACTFASATTVAPGYLDLRDLSAAMATPDGPPSFLIHPEPFAGRRADSVLWTTSEQLKTRDVREQVDIALRQGESVFVRRVDPADTSEREFFGIQGVGRSAIYRRSAQGGVRMVSVRDAVTGTDAADALQAWNEQEKRASRPRPQVFSAGATLPVAGAYVPTLTVSEADIFPGGRRIAHDIVVMRDVSASDDEFVVIVRSETDQAAEWTGILWDGEFNVRNRPNGYTLLIPDEYRVSTSLHIEGEGGDGAPTALTLENYQPASDGVTTRRVDETVSVTASHNVGADAETLSGLGSQEALLLGKLPITFSSGSEQTETRTVSVDLKDYYTYGEPMRDGHTYGARWAFPLSRDIAEDADYFIDPKTLGTGGRAWYSLARATTMMKRAALQTASTWRFGAGRGGRLVIETASDVTNRAYDAVAKTTRSEADDPASTIRFSMEIDLDSPHLARQPTVRIASETGAGCLTQTDASSPGITLAPCERGETGAAQHWNLGVDGTYRNRASHQCLTTDEGDGTVYAADCGQSESFARQWFWSADRLHSKVAGETWRLHLRDGMPNARFDPALHDDIRPNEYHALLNPWTQYPNKPMADYEIPRLSGDRRTKVYESFLTYGAVSSDQRWTPRPVRR